MSKLEIDTRPFGKIEIPEEEVIRFPHGILAFEEYNRFIILSEKDDSVFHWLQSIDDPQLAFLVIDPSDVLPDYQPALLTAEISTLFGDTLQEDMTLYCICTIPTNHPEKMTINLQGPLVLDTRKKLGGQFISNDESHQVRTPLLELVEAGETA